MKKLFENWNKYKNQSEELEEGVETITPENIQLALQALEQIGINFAPAIAGLGAFEAARLIKQKLTGEAPQEAPPLDEARADHIGGIDAKLDRLGDELENTSESEEQEKDKKDVYEKGYSDGQQGYNFSSSYHGKMRDIYLDGNLAGAEGL